MNTLIAFACLLAVAAAKPGNLGYSTLGAYNGLGYAGLGYSGLGYNGLGYNGLGYAGLGYAHAAPVALASEPRLVDPVAIAAGAPLPTGDTIEVAAAKAAHLQAHAVETVRNHGLYAHAAPLAYSGYSHASPLAYAHASPLAYAHAAPLALASEARLVDPVAIAAGAPLPTGDTIEVAAAKAAHFQAHAAAKSGHFLRYKRGLAYGAHHAVAYNAPLVAAAHPVAHHAVAYNAPLVAAAHPVAHHAVAYNAPLVAAAHPVAHHAVAYNAPLVAAAHPVAHHAVAYNAPLVAAAHPVAHHAVAYNAHPIAHHAVAYNAPLVSAAHSYSAVSHVSHPYAHAYGHHY